MKTHGIIKDKNININIDIVVCMHVRLKKYSFDAVIWVYKILLFGIVLKKHSAWIIFGWFLSIDKNAT